MKTSILNLIKFLIIIVLVNVVMIFNPKEIYATDNTYVSGLQTYQYTINTDNTVNITGYEGSEYVVNIPQKINNMNVVSIDNYAFQNATRMQQISIPSTVTRPKASIGEHINSTLHFFLRANTFF